jgi:rfaE bifunctional protein nucleotidyltransferase chain/domain
MTYLDKILNQTQALTLREHLKTSGKKLVFTNGCFDLIHPGHLRYLEEAKGLGDYLLVALNSDASVRRLKGPSRPILNEMERTEILAALMMVDGVVIFGEDTPLELITKLKPDFLVKGGDYLPDNIVGGAETMAHGGKVISLSLCPGFSTTTIVKKIRAEI